MTDASILVLVAFGGDVDAFLRGAREMDEHCQQIANKENPAFINALLKYLAYQEGKDMEVFMPYCMRLKALSEWYMQLLAESLGVYDTLKVPKKAGHLATTYQKHF